MNSRSWTTKHILFVALLLPLAPASGEAAPKAASKHAPAAKAAAKAPAKSAPKPAAKAAAKKPPGKIPSPSTPRAGFLLASFGGARSHCPFVPGGGKREKEFENEEFWNPTSGRFQFDYETQYLRDYQAQSERLPESKRPPVATIAFACPSITPGSRNFDPLSIVIEDVLKKDTSCGQACTTGWQQGFHLGAGRAKVQEAAIPYSVTQACSDDASTSNAVDSMKLRFNENRSVRWTCCRNGFIAARKKFVEAIRKGISGQKLQNCAADYNDGKKVGNALCSKLSCPQVPERTAYKACWGAGFDEGFIDCVNQGKVDPKYVALGSKTIGPGPVDALIRWDWERELKDLDSAYSEPETGGTRSEEASE